ncbi:MAG: hypothetical protein U0T81_01535 [Saprospiraceae bacterium]
MSTKLILAEQCKAEPPLDFAMNDKILKGNVNIETDYFDADNFMNSGNVQTAFEEAEIHSCSANVFNTN